MYLHKRTHPLSTSNRSRVCISCIATKKLTILIYSLAFYTSHIQVQFCNQNFAKTYLLSVPEHARSFTNIFRIVTDERLYFLSTFHKIDLTVLIAIPILTVNSVLIHYCCISSGKRKMGNVPRGYSLHSSLCTHDILDTTNR